MLTARKRKRKATPPPKPTPHQELAEFARTILMYPRSHRPGFWEFAAEALLIRFLPEGLDSALDRLRSIKDATTELCQRQVIVYAEHAITGHLQRLETFIPKGSVNELYRNWRERHPECLS